MNKNNIIYNLDNLESQLFDDSRMTSNQRANYYRNKILNNSKFLKAFKEFPKTLLSVEKDLKTIKSTNVENYLTAIQYLYPLKESCIFAKTANCSKDCLKDSNNSIIFESINIYRLRKALFKIQYPLEYLKLLKKDIEKFIIKCTKRKLKPAIRLNGISDYIYENDYLIFNEVIKHYTIKNNVKFYDYTKNALRDTKGYIDLTFSYSGMPRYRKYVDMALKNRMRIATVFQDKETLNRYIKQGFLKRKVISGDNHDLTFIHNTNVILGLSAKGFLKHDKNNPFVVR